MSKKYPFPWWYYAITSPVMFLFCIYSIVYERVWARGWIYKSDQPFMYWILVAILLVGFLGATYQLYVSLRTGKRV